MGATQEELSITSLSTANIDTSASGNVTQPGKPRCYVPIIREHYDRLFAALGAASERSKDLLKDLKDLQAALQVIQERISGMQCLSPEQLEDTRREVGASVRSFLAEVRSFPAEVSKANKILPLEIMAFQLAYDDSGRLAVVTTNLLGFPMAYKFAVAEALLYCKRWRQARDPVAYLCWVVSKVYKPNLEQVLAYENTFGCEPELSSVIPDVLDDISCLKYREVEVILDVKKAMQAVRLPEDGMKLLAGAYDGISGPEVAARLGWDVRRYWAAKKSVTRAKLKLKRFLGRYRPHQDRGIDTAEELHATEAHSGDLLKPLRRHVGQLPHQTAARGSPLAVSTGELVSFSAEPTPDAARRLPGPAHKP